MAEIIKAANFLSVPAVVTTIGVPHALFSAQNAAASVVLGDGNCSVFIQNQTAGDLTLSTDVAAATGLLITNNNGFTFDLSEEWAGTMYAVAGIGNILIAVMRTK